MHPSLRRSFAAALVAIVCVVALAGCIEFGEVAAKTDKIYGQVKDLPGVTDSSVEVTENSAFSARRSAIYLDVADGISADQVGTIISTFAHANVETGTDKVSAELHLVNETTTMRNEFQVQYAPLTDATATALADTWVELLGSTDGASITVAYASSGYDVALNVALGGDPTIQRDLDALANAGAYFDALGPVHSYNQADGRFSATGGIPGPDAIAQLAYLQAAAVSVGGDISGAYYAESDLNSVKVVVPVAASAIDPANGLPTSLETVVDAIPAGAFPVVFGVNDENPSIDGVTGIEFSNTKCDRYTTLVSLEPSRTLLLYWARDGRTMLDGSTAESCFA
ncbi:MAG: hypothetical protein ABJB03_11605 [Rhodoglobus sp.]